MHYIVMGADGQLAGRVADFVFEQAPQGAQLTFTVYQRQRLSLEKLQRWEAGGVRVLEASYDDVASMERAFENGDRVYIVSGLEIGRRVEQHKQAIDTAIRMGISHITYSSFIGATDPLYKDSYVTPDHTATEEYLKSTGIAYNAMRNNLYMENYVALYPMLAFMSNNEMHTTAGDGKATLVHKDDCARAAAAVLLGKGEDFKAYNIVGPEAISVHDLCDLVSKESGIPLKFVADSKEDYIKHCEEVLHIPRYIDGDFSRSPIPFCSEDGATNDETIRDGLMNVPSNDIELLTGQKPKRIEDIIKNYSYVWEEKVNHWTQLR